MGKGELKFAGIVTEALHLQTKKGKPWGKFKLEDYKGDFEFLLFGDDYLNNQQFLNPNYFLFVSGLVMMSRYRNEPEFKVSKISLLSDLREKIAKEINLTVNLEQVTDTFIDDLDALINENEGNCRVIMKFKHKGEGLDANGLLRGKKVYITDPLIETLDKMDIKYALN